MDDAGVFYIATGEQFVDEAEVSARSVRNVMPDIPIAIATDVEPRFKFDYVIDIPNPKHGFVDQIENLHRSPFDKTLHLDTDIYVNDCVNELFELLNQFAIGVAHNHNREVYDPPGVPDSFPEYNTGVVAYRNDDKFRQFTKTWGENYAGLINENGTQNQPSFRKTLYESDLRIATLTPEYNCMVRYPGHVRNRVKIAHSRLLDIQTPGATKSVEVMEAINNLNSCSGHRLYVPNSENGVTILYNSLDSDAPVHEKVMNMIRVHGIRYTVKRLKSEFINQVSNRK
ncbi:hypothetical protein [Natronosalvus amylolyticus]|uniref:hypothetical protein n=1 Tax=Natronosalvus amylolyticus TaxID=2961994 RepID=UPI0020C969A8|nr:hypothetical protein [Natronosalvus amylolyticus]